MALDTTYGPGFSQTTTGNYNPGSPSAGIRTPDLSGVAAAIIAKRQADEQRRRQEMQTMNQQQAAAMQPPAAEHMASGLDMAREEAEIAKLHAMSDPSPMKYTYPLGSAGFLTQDTDAMSGAQRQAYLPQNSQQIGGFGPGAASTLPDQGPQLGAETNAGPQLDTEALRMLQAQALLGGERRRQ